MKPSDGDESLGFSGASHNCFANIHRRTTGTCTPSPRKMCARVSRPATFYLPPCVNCKLWNIIVTRPTLITQLQGSSDWNPFQTNELCLWRERFMRAFHPSVWLVSEYVLFLAVATWRPHARGHPVIVGYDDVSTCITR